MNWTRLIEYLLVVLVAIIVSLAIIWYAFPRGSDSCVNCAANVARLRSECDKQFSSYGTNATATQLDSMWEQEELIAFVEQAPDSGTGDGFSSAVPASSTVVTPGPGYVLIRVQPEEFSAQGGGRAPDVNTLPAETPWEKVTVKVARYVNHLRSDEKCEGVVKLRDGKFEFFCDGLTNKFDVSDYGQVSYRVYIRNESSIGLSYCFISNCSDSAPWGGGRLCEREQQIAP